MIAGLSACATASGGPPPPSGPALLQVPRSELASALAQCEADDVIEDSAGQYYVLGCGRLAIYACDARPDSDDAGCTRLAVGDPAALLPEDRSAEAIKGRATRLFEAGREAYKEGRHLEACNLLSESDQLLRTPGSAANLGNCKELDGHPDLAWELYDAIPRLTTSTADEPVLKLARTRAAAIAAKLCTLTITLADPAIPGLTVWIGDRRLAPAATIRTVVQPTTMAVVIGAPNAEPFRKTIRAMPGASIPIVVPADSLRVTAPRDAPSAASEPTETAPAALPRPR